ncbi:MAG: redox-sensing transcriptional repressor Rex [Spirochaetia bacterium]|nr:redox-sensing transcriptional repressor Rex [Spirochaetia bacterium]
MKGTYKLNSIPLPSLRRLPRYLNILESFHIKGKHTVSATDIAEELDLKPIQIRKDMAFTGIVGKPKVGYDINELIKSIRSFIGWHENTSAILVGAGSLGTALMGYEGFLTRGLRIEAAFDTDVSKHGTLIYDTPVYPMRELSKIVQRKNIHLAVITVPVSAAQSVTDTLVESGINGIWNFSPAEIQVPKHVIVKREDLSEGLAVLFVQMQEIQHSEE